MVHRAAPFPSRAAHRRRKHRALPPLDRDRLPRGEPSQRRANPRPLGRSRRRVRRPLELRRGSRSAASEVYARQTGLREYVCRAYARLRGQTARKTALAHPLLVPHAARRAHRSFRAR
jgi:hypothetical protein